MVRSLRLVAAGLFLLVAGCGNAYVRWMPREQDLEWMFPDESPAAAGDAGEAEAIAPPEPAAADTAKTSRKDAATRVTDQPDPKEQRQAFEQFTQRAAEKYGEARPEQVIQEKHLGSFRVNRWREFSRNTWRNSDPYAIFSKLLKIKGNGGPDAPERPEKVAELIRTNRQKLLAMYRDEFEEIDLTKPGKPYSKRIGLALSGGGIRSASFATGILQGLQQIGVLEDVGYLSTVSGGGYAGAWYMMQGRPNQILAPGSLDLHHVA